jgi:hypothetical protein
MKKIYKCLNMKKLFLTTLIATTIISCNKTKNITQLEMSTTYTIEGYLYSKQSDDPVVGCWKNKK